MCLCDSQLYNCKKARAQSRHRLGITVKAVRCASHFAIMVTATAVRAARGFTTPPHVRSRGVVRGPSTVEMRATSGGGGALIGMFVGGGGRAIGDAIGDTFRDTIGDPNRRRDRGHVENTINTIGDTSEDTVGDTNGDAIRDTTPTRWWTRFDAVGVDRGLDWWSEARLGI